MKRIVSRLKQAAAHPLARGSVIVFIGTMVANISAYLYHLVVGRILGPAGYGELAALLSLSYILNVFATVLQTVVTRFVAQHTVRGDYGSIKALVVKLTWFLVSVGFVCVGALTVFAPVIASYLHIRDTIVLYFLFSTVVVTMLCVVFSSVLQGMQRFTAGMVIANVSSVLRLIGGALAAGFGVTATLAAGLGAGVAAALITIIPIWKIFTVKSQTSSIHLRPLFQTSLTTFLAVLGVSILNSQDVVLVKHFFPALASGWYGALSTMGKIIFFASSSVMYVLLPIVSQRSATGKKSQSLIYASVGIVAAMSAVITAGFFVLPQLALRLLYGTAFLEAAPYLGLFGVFSSLYTVAYIIVIALLGLGKSSVWVILIGAALTQNVLISFLHSDISTVIWANIALSAALVATLLVYYRHAHQEH